MLTFIKLTGIKGENVLINASNIIFVNDDGDDRYIAFLDKHTCHVKETINEIEKLIEEAQC
jgi:hypothetical protein